MLYICSMAKATGKSDTFKIDDIIDDIIEGKTFRKMADKYECSISLLHKFLCRDEYTARVREAMELSAGTYANKGEQVLLDAPAVSVEIQRARELAQHYRWMAAKRAPNKYGEKVDITTLGEKLEQSYFIAGKEIKF